MIKFFTSLSFLYILSISVLIVYGLLYYKKFSRNRSQSKGFPLVFGLVGLSCLGFLYFNIHAPLSLKTFSNLDHQFIRHEGFRVKGSIELGRTDTVNFTNNQFNSFIIARKGNTLSISSPYSEEPFYASVGEQYKLLSTNFPANKHSFSFQSGSAVVELFMTSDTSYQLYINDALVSNAAKKISKGLSGWNLFKDQESFIGTSWYTDEKIGNALKNVYFLRDAVSRTGFGDMKFFVAGKFFQYVEGAYHDAKKIEPGLLAFSADLTDQSSIAWGLGFFENNRNQFRASLAGQDSFALQNKYPVSYPLTEEHNQDWSAHAVNKFLVSDSRDLQGMSPVFNEGFLFAPFNADSSIDFSPVLLTYRKDKANANLALNARFMNGRGSPVVKGNQILLPAKSGEFAWLFSIQNSFDWKLGGNIFSPSTWEGLLFGSLLLFFILVLASSIVIPADKLSWIWQLLSSITLVLLTTRFFLYWRYKSFPPFEDLDLPSVQQLNSFWNFGIVVLTTVLLGIIFGFGFLKFIYRRLRRLFNNRYSDYKNDARTREEKIAVAMASNRAVKKTGIRVFYFISWFLILLGCGAIAALNDFDPTTCRHLALALVAFYFLYLYISYKHSPLVVGADKSWWGIRTGKTFDIIMSNPVKVLLSVSLLALFVFIDIGFAIIFLNFLLFNEAFLCFNYAIAGLSAGSRRNANYFGLFGFLYLLVFVLNLVYGPYIFRYMLELSTVFYLAGYLLFAILIAFTITRLLHRSQRKKKVLVGTFSAIGLFLIAFLFFPREKILDKAALTKYRIDVMTMPVDQAVERAYEEGKTYEPVIRAAQNQWFINTFIFEKNNPAVQQAGFHLLPHAPQSKGAKYNAQATDLVASRFLIAEHGKWSVLFYVLLLLVPTVLIAAFYKLYPDFTNRINSNYPTITAGFSLLNYLLITALLVILAATGRYIFFGQDLPFGSILSKQSILWPSLLIVAIVSLFRNIPLEEYPNRKKLIPGTIVFAGLALLLFLVKPAFNKDREFGVADLAKEMDGYIVARLQPLYDEIDTAKANRRFTLRQKDKLFTDTLRQLLEAGWMSDAGMFFQKELDAYAKGNFSRHLDQRRLLYLDLYSGKPQLAVNDNYFRIDPPPHLQQLWTGNVFSDTSNYNISLWNASTGKLTEARISSYGDQPAYQLTDKLQLVFRKVYADYSHGELVLVKSNGDSVALPNPSRLRISDDSTEMILSVQPDAFMKNYYVNGNRFYVYPMAGDFIWARNFAESISSEYTAKGQAEKNAFLSLDAMLTDSLTAKIRSMVTQDTSYKKGAEYAISIADGNGRLIAMADFIKGLRRPDPNDKAVFNKVIRGENGYVSQSLLRKQVGNLNLLRMNPGPGSTLKPIVFAAIASQLNLDWDGFAAEGFNEKQQFFGGEKVGDYDFEKNNGRISSVVDYLRYSDNYYHSNLLLLGSYSRQSLQTLLTKYFATKAGAEPGEIGVHWPYFSYKGKQYWLNGFENWPGYSNGKANFGSDSSFVSKGLLDNFGIYTYRIGRGAERFNSAYDSLLFREAYRKSGFILPEYALFDQKGTGMDNGKPNEVFMSSFRGHVKGSSQVMVAPVKMLDAFGKLVSQNRDYQLTLNPYADGPAFHAFETDPTVAYSNYLAIMKEKLWEGLSQALVGGTAARLGAMLKDQKEFYYYAKTGTTGDDELKTKSKLFAFVISKKKLTDPDFNFRKNKFYTIYFTSQNGPAKQNEEFQAEIIKYIQESEVFRKYMGAK